jgi:hypothetical protein
VGTGWVIFIVGQQKICNSDLLVIDRKQDIIWFVLRKNCGCNKYENK